MKSTQVNRYLHNAGCDLCSLGCASKRVLYGMVLVDTCVNVCGIDHLLCFLIAKSQN